MATPTPQQLDEIHMALRGYIWWTGPQGYKLSMSRGHSKYGNAPRYSLTCPYPDKLGREVTYKHKRFWTDQEAVAWAQAIVEKDGKNGNA